MIARTIKMIVRIIKMCARAPFLAAVRVDKRLGVKRELMMLPLVTMRRG